MKTLPSLTQARLESPAATLVAEYTRVRSMTMALAAPLSAEDAQVQSMPDASPAKWHLAHTTWFFETFMLERFETGFEPFDSDFRVLFNSYYQGIGARYPRLQRGLLTRPTFEEIKQYRCHVDGRMQAVIPAMAGDPAFDALLQLGLHHEQQHQELLLTDIKHAFSHNAKRASYASRWPIAGVRPDAVKWLGYEAALVEHGHDATLDGSFCFDNETPQHRVFVAAFELASRPATNGEYLAFIMDGGYQRPELWLSQGWDWVTQGQRHAPLYWRGEGSAWRHHTLQGLVDIDPHTPVCHLGYFEADAFARWAGARLPTEHEWERAARALKNPADALQRANLSDRGAYHPLPAPLAVTDEPVQMYGDVWEWTSSSYNAYPGFQVLPGAVGEYNGKFMVNQYVLRGGSCATPSGHMRASYRNFFPSDAQWQFTGVRLARDAAHGRQGTCPDPTQQERPAP